ncbi:hypothetical protein [Alteromonas aestuariivivens]|uniref:hypothetical protein n=1 Tax=Alteromonas aestuariivivens TaxID=1938339 RepID=UPI001FE5C6C8|nr:hypothetical protein [Alteromonas aestuariivivens]
MSPSITCQQLDKQTFRQVKVYSGISPNVLRRVFGGWVLFAVIVGALVSFAPHISIQFEVITFIILMLFTVAMFWQSRISEGWPSLLLFQNRVCVVRDPQAREFICIPPSYISAVRPTIIKPNKRAVEIVLNPDALSAHDTLVLGEAIWPRTDRVLVLTHFKSRERVCAELKQWLDKYVDSATNN